WLLFQLAALRWREALPPRLRGFVLAGLVLALLPSAARAEAAKAPAPDDSTPSADILEELQTRLLRPPACAPHCVATAQLQVAIEGGELRLSAEVHAGAASAWAIPGPAESWVPRTVSVDGQ